ncbi:hypothetical protein GQ42DRAFT_181238 [Ramicandelaber brevisporus]|nr:hypothetical protein GQ42DRAFT_181238 [Ramicandelaber brevisporus]
MFDSLKHRLAAPLSAIRRRLSRKTCTVSTVASAPATATTTLPAVSAPLATALPSATAAVELTEARTPKQTVGDETGLNAVIDQPMVIGAFATWDENSGDNNNISNNNNNGNDETVNGVAGSLYSDNSSTVSLALTAVHISFLSEQPISIETAESDVDSVLMFSSVAATTASTAAAPNCDPLQSLQMVGVAPTRQHHSENQQYIDGATVDDCLEDFGGIPIFKCPGRLSRNQHHYNSSNDSIGTLARASTVVTRHVAPRPLFQIDTSLSHSEPALPSPAPSEFPQRSHSINSRDFNRGKVQERHRHVATATSRASLMTPPYSPLEEQLSPSLHPSDGVGILRPLGASSSPLLPSASHNKKYLSAEESLQIVLDAIEAANCPSTMTMTQFLQVSCEVASRVATQADTILDGAGAFRLLFG